MYKMPKYFNTEQTTSDTTNTTSGNKTQDSRLIWDLKTLKASKNEKAPYSKSGKDSVKTDNGMVVSEKTFPTFEIGVKPQSTKNTSMDFNDLSPNKLQEAIIWSEILGKPMCKRRERRERWQ